MVNLILYNSRRLAEGVISSTSKPIKRIVGTHTYCTRVEGINYVMYGIGIRFGWGVRFDVTISCLILMYQELACLIC